MTETVTKEQLLSADFVSDIFLEEDPTVRQEEIGKYQIIAKGYGCKGQFDALVKAHKQMIKEERKRLADEAAKSAVQIVSNQYDTFYRDDIVSFQTGKWQVSDHGIVCQEGKMVTVAGYYPIIITQILTDMNTGDEKLELAWKKKGVIKKISALRSVVGSSSEIVKLSRYGLPVTTETAKYLIRYLSDFEALNNIDTRVSSSKFGWMSADVFVPYTDEIYFDATNGIKALTESVHAEGNYDTWLDLAREIRASGRKEPMVALAASFGSVMIDPLNLLPFIVNLYGTTGSGKTVTLMLATSIWASPNEGGYISESNSTINALEGKLDTLNHLPLMVDDLSKLRSDDKGGLMNLIYGLCSGRGKGRMGRNGELRYTPTWGNAIITNMERPLSDDSMRGGAMNRILDFEVQPGDIYQDGNAVVTVLSENFGHAGMRYVEVCDETGFKAIRAIMNKYRERIKEYAMLSGEEREEKQMTPLAVMLTADYLSEKYIFQDGQHLDIDYCMKAVKSRKQVSEMERAYKHFVDAVYMNQSKFDTGTSDYTDGDVWGKWVSETYVAVIPSALERIADQSNFNVSQFVEWLKNTDRLEHESNRNTRMVRLRGSSKRCYKIRMDETEQETTFIQGEMDLLPEEPLPFDMPV